MEKVKKEIMIQTLAELADMLPADGRKRDFISIRIARRGYTIYRMTPQTTAEIMTARHINKEPDKSEACIAAMRIVSLWLSLAAAMYSPGSEYGFCVVG